MDDRDDELFGDSGSFDGSAVATRVTDELVGILADELRLRAAVPDWDALDALARDLFARALSGSAREVVASLPGELTRIGVEVARAQWIYIGPKIDTGIRVAIAAARRN